MKTIVTLIITLALATTANAQYNMVTNYSFEDLPYCPTVNNELSIALYWSGPTNNGSNIGNVCSTVFPLPNAVPNYVYQWPVTGNGAAAFFAYNVVGANYRTYLQNRMTDSLQQGKCYYVAFYINYLDPTMYCVKGISLNFDKQQISTTGTGYVLALTPHITKFGNPYIGDTLPWVKVEGIYTAQGGERYLTIGNFNDDAHTDTLQTNYGQYPGADYLVDDVFVIPIDSMPNGLSAYAGSDTAITLGDSVFIGQELSNLNCTWQKLGDSTLLTCTLSGLYVQPTSTASYIVTQTLCGTITKDTVTITVNSVTATRYAMFSNSITLYPNPTHNTFNIAVANATTAPYAITIQDAQVRTLQQANYLPQQGIIHIDTPLANGVYFIHIAQGEYAVTKKIVVQH
jgi:hypothetical protein